MFHKLKQFNDLRKQANTLKGKLATEKVTVEKKGVTLTMDGNQEILEVKIDQSFLTPDKKSLLEGEIKNAVNECVKKAQRVMASKMKEMGGFNIPGMQ